MDVFRLRDSIIGDYSKYIGSFIEISDDRIREIVQQELTDGLLWPDPLLQLNPAFAWGGWIDDLVSKGTLHSECAKIFRGDKSEVEGAGRPMRLYQHQVDAIEAARTGGLLGGGAPEYNIYPAKDGFVAVAALEPRFRERLFAHLGGVNLAEEFRAIFASRNADEWERLGEELDIPIVKVVAAEGES